MNPPLPGHPFGYRPVVVDHVQLNGGIILLFPRLLNNDINIILEPQQIKSSLISGVWLFLPFWGYYRGLRENSKFSKKKHEKRLKPDNYPGSKGLS